MTGLVEPIDDTPEDEADDTEDPMATPTTVLGSIVPGPSSDPVEPNYSFLDDGEGEPAAGIEPEDAP